MDGDDVIETSLHIHSDWWCLTFNRSNNRKEIIQRIKMVKKQDKQMYWILGIAFLVLLMYGGNQGWFKSTFTTIDQNPFTPFPNEILTEYDSYNVNLDVSPNSICSGDLYPLNHAICFN